MLQAWAYHHRPAAVAIWVLLGQAVVDALISSCRVDVDLPSLSNTAMGLASREGHLAIVHALLAVRLLANPSPRASASPAACVALVCMHVPALLVDSPRRELSDGAVAHVVMAYAVMTSTRAFRRRRSTCSYCLCSYGLCRYDLDESFPMALWHVRQGRPYHRPIGLSAYGPTGLRAYGPTGLRAYDPMVLRAYGPIGLSAYGPTGL